MSDFTYVPSTSARQGIKFRPKEVSFGDGYAQRVVDGINTEPEVWNVAFDQLTLAVASTIMLFLEGKKGVTSFTWTPPQGAESSYVCQTLTRTWKEGALNTVNAVFKEVFE